MNIEDARALDLTDSVGAAKMRSCTVDMIHWHVKQKNLRSYQFVDGVLTLREPGEQTRGKDLFFLRSDVEALPYRTVGRPRKQKPISDSSKNQSKTP